MRRGSVDLIYRKKKYIWSAIFFILIILNTDIAVTISAASDKKKKRFQSIVIDIVWWKYKTEKFHGLSQ